MKCEKTIPYLIKYGDSLYEIAKRYNTTVSDILTLNQGLDAFNLRVGSEITICQNSIGENFNGCKSRMSLVNSMRLAWEQHIYWTRMLLISLSAHLDDTAETQARLMRNPRDIALIFSYYYPPDAAEAIERLLATHLSIGGRIITALINRETTLAETLTEQWYQNANEIAQLLSSLNPFYQKDELEKLLKEHLMLTTTEVLSRLQQHYSDDINAFNNVERAILSLSDYLSNGIISQFPEKFT